MFTPFDSKIIVLSSYLCILVVSLANQRKHYINNKGSPIVDWYQEHDSQ